MSGTHTPTSDHDTTRTRITRTVGIIKNHALKHRMTIERRIEEASFEIVKERQMEFDQNSDRDFLHELFENDTPSLFEGPVWVYILERRRAVEVWNALMGEEDPELARVNSPNSLRAVYGVDLAQNAVMGSPNADIAEEQISCLFQSSPPFPPHEADELDIPTNIEHELSSGLAQANWVEREEVLSPSSSHLSQSAQLTSSGSRKGTSVTSSGSYKDSGSATTQNGKASFKARPIPKTNLVPDIEPRTTRSAALRAGVAVPGSPGRPRIIPTKEELKQVFMDVPGHKRSSTIYVASTAPPAIAPRMSRAASLRLGQKDPASPSSPKSRPTHKSETTFEGVPGHKRRETITVASVRAPTVSPRLNKSSELRAKRDSAPPTSFMFRQPTTPKIPGGLSRTPSQSSLSSSRPGSSMARSSNSTSRPSSSMANLGNDTSNGRFSSVGRSASRAMVSSLSPSQSQSASPVATRSIPPRPPSIEPRSNRSAMLRAKAGQGNSLLSTPVKKVPVGRRASMTA